MNGIGLCAFSVSEIYFLHYIEVRRNSCTKTEKKNIMVCRRHVNLSSPRANVASLSPLVSVPPVDIVQQRFILSNKISHPSRHNSTDLFVIHLMSHPDKPNMTDTYQCAKATEAQNPCDAVLAVVSVMLRRIRGRISCSVHNFENNASSN